MATPNDLKGWHLDKSINVGYVLTALGFLVGSMIWGLRQEARIAMLEQAVTRLADKEKEQDAAQAELRQQIREDLKELRADLKTLVERKR